MILIKRIGRFFLLMLTLGIMYAALELFYRGYTYVQMIWVGGLAGVCVGLLNDHPAYYNRRMWQQCFLGTLITVLIELVSGIILNKQMHLGIWDYSKVPFNFDGQICLRATAAWFFLMPLAVYADDWLKWKLFNERMPDGTPFRNYALLFTGR